MFIASTKNLVNKYVYYLKDNEIGFKLIGLFSKLHKLKVYMHLWLAVSTEVLGVFWWNVWRRCFTRNLTIVPNFEWKCFKRNIIRKCFDNILKYNNEKQIFRQKCEVSYKLVDLNFLLNCSFLNDLCDLKEKKVHAVKVTL